MSPWPTIAQQISDTTGCAFVIEHRRQVGGGCINLAYIVEGGARAFFVKLNSASLVEMFAAEAAGLEEIRRSKTLRTPTPIAYGTTAGSAYLVLEFLALTSRHLDHALLGEQLAQMHLCTQPHYGWWRDNTIGSTPQQNHPHHATWVSFWRDCRLKKQLDLAARNGYSEGLQARGEQLLTAVAAFFAHYTPPASLLHGDLWSGNVSALESGLPVVFDPATYYGDRESDIAMTELFGGFHPRFYAAYQATYPLDPGYTSRKRLYNLYHVLNHLNLFGGGYLAQAEGMIDQLLSELM